MMLQEIVEKVKKASWLRMCTLNNIDKWEMIKYLEVSVFPSRDLIKPGLALLTEECKHCGAKLDIGQWHGSFVAVRKCKCYVDGNNHMTRKKLSCILNDSQINLAFSMVNAAKKVGMPNMKEHWIKLGMSEDHAITKAAGVQKATLALSPASKKGARGYSKRTIEYWEKRGFSTEESREKVKQFQTTNGLEYYAKKYGEAGEQMFNARIEKWLNAPGNKNMIKGRSKGSIELFDKLGVGFYGPEEKTVRGKVKVHRIDFIFENKIIEFFGDYWHGNPEIYTEDYVIRKRKITDVWEHGELPSD